ncbi:phenoloxidase-activating factor 2-like isoform X2 [Artemia franciscana]|uniref:Peptidase S1 domain-containing protein n=2 Tax=Artemia franciscana TaxID=6661 RepID=A0AA88L6U7_ARTSF|nr:hypothetical protein QYM36_009921 [Artemia franciscana]
MKSIIVFSILFATAFAAPQVVFGESEEDFEVESRNEVPRNEAKQTLSDQQLAVRQGVLAGYLNLPPEPNLQVKGSNKGNAELTNVTVLEKSPYSPNGPSNGNCLCVPAANCNNPGPAIPGSGIANPNSLPPPPPPGEGLQSGSGSEDGQGLIDIRIVNRTPTNICQAGLVYCCVSNPVLPPVAPPPPAGLQQCGAPKPQPIPDFVPDPTQAQFGEFPWMVVILGPNNNYIGGGALIDGRHIITAAHRVAQHANGGQGIKVRLGEWDAKQNTEPLKYVEVPVTDIRIHPFFNPANLKNDIALLKLPEAVNFAAAPHVAPVCIPNFAQRNEGKRCWVTGWGKDAFGAGGQFQYILRKVDIPILHASDCENRLRSTRLGPIFQLDRTSFVCAGGEPGRDACQGDGGSPLVCETEPNRFEVVGLVAWGIGCAEPGIPGVYVNVASYVDWIIKEISTP